jgi:hypothetical protein
VDTELLCDFYKCRSCPCSVLIGITLGNFIVILRTLFLNLCNLFICLSLCRLSSCYYVREKGFIYCAVNAELMSVVDDLIQKAAEFRQSICIAYETGSV